MPSGEGNENGEKITIGIKGVISKKATLHMQHTVFVHFFAVVLHDYNVKLPRMPIYRARTICRFSAIFTPCKSHDH